MNFLNNNHPWKAIGEYFRILFSMVKCESASICYYHYVVINLIIYPQSIRTHPEHINYPRCIQYLVFGHRRWIVVWIGWFWANVANCWTQPQLCVVVTYFIYFCDESCVRVCLWTVDKMRAIIHRQQQFLLGKKKQTNDNKTFSLCCSVDSFSAFMYPGHSISLFLQNETRYAYGKEVLFRFSSPFAIIITTVNELNWIVAQIQIEKSLKCYLLFQIE